MPILALKNKFGMLPALCGDISPLLNIEGRKGKTLFIDARKMDYMVDRKHRDFTEEDIRKLADTFEAFQNGTLEEVKGFCAVADLPAIAKQDYILAHGCYCGN